MVFGKNRKNPTQNCIVAYDGAAAVQKVDIRPSFLFSDKKWLAAALGTILESHQFLQFVHIWSRKTKQARLRTPGEMSRSSKNDRLLFVSSISSVDLKLMAKSCVCFWAQKKKVRVFNGPVNTRNRSLIKKANHRSFVAHFWKRIPIARGQNAVLRGKVFVFKFPICYTKPLHDIENTNKAKTCFWIYCLQTINFTLSSESIVQAKWLKCTIDSGLQLSGYQRYLKNKDFYARKSTGRPKKFTAREERQIMRLIKNNPRGTKNYIFTCWKITWHSFSTKRSFAVTVRQT